MNKEFYEQPTVEVVAIELEGLIASSELLPPPPSSIDVVVPPFTPPASWFD